MLSDRSRLRHNRYFCNQRPLLLLLPLINQRLLIKLLSSIADAPAADAPAEFVT